MTGPRQAVVFDVDGTLITGSGANLQSLTTAVRDLFGLTVTVDYVDELPLINGVLVRGWVDSQFLEHLTRLAGHDYAAAGPSLRRAYVTQYVTDLANGADPGRIIPGVEGALRTLRSQGVALAMATGNSTEVARAKMNAHGLGDLFAYDPNLGFGDTHPHRTAIGAAAVAGVHPADQVYLVGDQASDMTSARANNAVAVGVLTGACTEAELIDAGAHTVLASVNGLPHLLAANRSSAKA